MNYEREVFQKHQICWESLLPYGFEKNKNTYRISRGMREEGMRMEVVIHEDGTLCGRVIDTEFQEEYTNFRIESALGAYASKIKEEYLAFLMDIRTHCFVRVAFYGDQANRIARIIEANYHDAPSFLWEKMPDSAVYKHPGNEKWYALIMGVEGNKVNCDEERVSILNVKLREQRVNELCTREGFVPAYHMNKAHWITLILNDTLCDDEIMGYIRESHSHTQQHREWR